MAREDVELIAPFLMLPIRRQAVPRRTAAEWSGAGDPQKFGPLLAWYDATQFALADGTAVASWPDRLGTYPLTIIGTANTYRANGLGRGRPGVDGTDAVNTFMNSSGKPYQFTSHASSVFVAFIPSPISNARPVEIPDYHIITSAPSQAWGIIDGGANINYSSQPTPLSRPIVLSVVQRALYDYDLGTNGQPVEQRKNPLSVTTGTSGLLGAAGMVIGEVLLYDGALAPAARQRAETYLLLRWT